MKQEEIRGRFCQNHREMLKQTLDPSWSWNPMFLLPKSSCAVEGCDQPAYWLVIGLKFPDKVGVIEREHGVCVANYEIDREAGVVLEQGDALEALTQYLYSRTSKVTKRKLFNKFAKLILKDLGINANIILTNNYKHKILNYLEMYPDNDT